MNLDQFASRMHPDAQKALNQRNEEINTLKMGIMELLWIEIKEKDNDYDQYIDTLTQVFQPLRDGFHTDANGNLFLSAQGDALPKYKPNAELHAGLKAIADKLNLSLTKAKALANRRAERQSYRATTSGTVAEREQFEGTKTSRAYAKKDNEQAIAEYEHNLKNNKLRLAN